jgi:hypothetical protein
MKSASATGRRLKNPLFAAGIGAVALLVATPPGRASLVPAMDLVDLTENASRVVLGEVVSVRSAWDRGRRYIYTTVELQVAEVWKGATPAGGRLKMVQPGGSVGDIEMRVFGLRSLREGERAVLFLGPGDPAWTVGLGQGQRPVRFDAAQRRWMVDPGDRSAVWRSGTSPPWQDGDGLTALDDLRQKVRTLVRR